MKLSKKKKNHHLSHFKIYLYYFLSVYVGMGEYMHVRTSVFGGQRHTGAGGTGHDVVSSGNTLRQMCLGLNEGEWATPKPVSQ